MLSNLDARFSIEDYEKRNDRFSLAICSLGTIFLFAFSLKSFVSGMHTYAYILAFFGLGAAALMIYYVHTDNRKVFQANICGGFTAINLYLLYTGGENDTAILWFYTYPLIIFTLWGAKRGLVLVSSVYMASVFILFFPSYSGIEAGYSMDTRLRFMGSMLFVIALGYIMETSRVQAQRSSNRANKLLKAMATRDELTGLYNRRAIRNIFEQSMDKETTLAICDVDFFKKINDRYGHDVGDKVLKRVALSLQHTLRDSDIVVRWGGEEFLILLPDTNLRDGVNIIERMRRDLAATSMEVDGHVLWLSISAGIVSSAEQSGWNEMVQKADKYLYQAKESGRNCSFTMLDDALF